MGLIPLCVPYSRKDEARRAGARWNAAERVWTCDCALLGTDAYVRLRPFVPRMHRPDLEPPFIRPWMVPQPLWGRNLRALLPADQWDVVRRHAYAAASHRCRVCGGRGPRWPVEADEAWAYDDAALTQTLKGVVALCPDCHHVRHWDKSMVDGREEEALAWVMRVNGWTRAEAEEAAATAFAEWERRSRLSWASDHSWVERTHGFRVDLEGERRADAANRELVAEATRRADLADERLPRPSKSEPPRVTSTPAAPRRRSLRSLVRSLLR